MLYPPSHPFPSCLSLPVSSSSTSSFYSPLLCFHWFPTHTYHSPLHSCSTLLLPIHSFLYPLRYNRLRPSSSQVLLLLLTHKDEGHVHHPGFLLAFTVGLNPHSNNSPRRLLHTHDSNIRNPLDSRSIRRHHPPLHRQSWSVHKTN